MIKRTITAPALALAAVGLAATPASAMTGPSYYNSTVVDAACGSANCILKMYQGVNWIWGINVKTITVPVGARVYGCQNWGITNGTYVGNSGVAAKLEAKHNYEDSASGTIRVGLYLNPVAYGSTDPDQPNYLRCGTHQDF